MYQIKKANNNFSFSEVSNPNDKNLKFPDKTNLEIRKINSGTARIGISVFFQESLPIGNILYWKVENGIVVDMTVEEIDIKKEKVKKAVFFGFKNKIFVYDQKALAEYNIEFLKFDREVKSAQRAGKAHIVESVIVMNEDTQQLRTEQTIFVDYINVAEMDYIQTLTTKKDNSEELIQLVTVTPYS